MLHAGAFALVAAKLPNGDRIGFACRGHAFALLVEFDTGRNVGRRIT